MLTIIICSLIAFLLGGFVGLLIPSSSKDIAAAYVKGYIDGHQHAHRTQDTSDTLDQ